jgi:hypothetical protein
MAHPFVAWSIGFPLGGISRAPMDHTPRRDRPCAKRPKPRVSDARRVQVGPRPLRAMKSGNASSALAPRITLVV